LELPAGFRIELLAAEPLVQDPVAIQWGADGKLWVAEMADYPYGIDGHMASSGRIRCLDDTDNDGKPDRSTLFLDKINFPTGVLPWRNGVLVTAAPEIFYAEDTDGDGKSDVRRTLFSGFKEGNPQLRVNGLQWGLDGWVYCANGWSGGVVKSEQTGKVVDLKRLDFRIQPDTGELELISGITEFGRNRDDWGNWFGCDNTNVAWHFVLADRYLRRNPHITAPDPRKHFFPPAPRVYPRSVLQKRYHTFEHADRYTSACAATPYRDTLLFADAAQHLFVCEPVHNLVQHLVLKDESSSFSATVPEHQQHRDFLTSSDPWFRPVNLRTGPDGALWVVDMYRYMIEHPDWLPDEGKQELKPHYRSGENLGRIYRIYHESRPPRTWRPLAGKNVEQLCDALASPNGWQRDIAQQQLTWAERSDARKQVAQLAANSTHAKVRLQALSTLATTGEPSRAELKRALSDTHPMVRRMAVRLVETNKNASDFLDWIVRLAADDHPAVRLQAACTLGEFNDAHAATGLATALSRAGDDPYLLAAVLSSLKANNLDAVFRQATDNAGAGILGAKRAGDLVSLAADLDRGDLVLGLFAGLSPSQQEYSLWQIEAAQQWLQADKKSKSHSVVSPELKQRAGAALSAILRWAERRAADSSAEPELRAACLRLSLRNTADRTEAMRFGVSVLEPQTPQAVQRVAVEELAAFDTLDAGKQLFDHWRSLGPSVRVEMLSAALTRRKLTQELIGRLEQGEVAPAEVDAASRQRLLSTGSDEFRNRAKRVFGETISADRQAVIRDLQDIQRLSGDAERGREVFAQKCATCHVFEQQGHAVGPDLGSLSDRTIPSLLTAILDPSRAIEPKFMLYQAITHDGRSFQGILAVETSGQIELVEQEGRRHVIPRDDLAELESRSKSLMPDGFEKELSRQQLIDLIRYLQH
jgi:putative membrane-bound dehydrogenase-like protein